MVVAGTVGGLTAAFVRMFSDVQKDVGAAQSKLNDTYREQIAALRSDLTDQESRWTRAMDEERNRCDAHLVELERRLRAEFGVST